jgi:ferredoxin-thioredoxin reductase catalytic chain
MSSDTNSECLRRIEKFVEKYCEKSGTTTHPDREVTECVVQGLARHLVTLGKPLCPCRFYPDKQRRGKASDLDLCL